MLPANERATAKDGQSEGRDGCTVLGREKERKETGKCGRVAMTMAPTSNHDKKAVGQGERDEVPGTMCLVG